MKNQYLCPECRSYLRVHHNIIFTVNPDRKEKRGILLLNPDLGNYTHISHASLAFNPGERVEFYCPVCHANLTAEGINDNLVKILLIDETRKEYDIYFSKICCEHSTFKIDRENIMAHYGKDSSGYLTYFSTPLNQQLHKD